MDKEQIKAIARSIWNIRREDEDRCDMEIEDLRESHSVFKEAEAAIESYKAELLKEVGEPVLYAEFAEDGGWLGDASESADHLEEPHALFTSDQVAAAIINATKQLEERRCEICGYAEHHREHTSCLRTQLAAAQEENGRLENQVLARDAELWGRTQEILGLKDQLATAEQRVSEACANYVNRFRPDFSQMREMLRAMQAGELTVSRGIEILDMWHAGNWNDNMLPPVRQDLIEEDSMPVEIIDRCNQQISTLTRQRGLAVEALDVALENLRPHGDNCFVSNNYEGDPGAGCNCGIDGVTDYLVQTLAAIKESEAMAQGEKP